MGKKFSRSDSSTTDGGSRVYERGSISYNRVVERPYGSSAFSSMALIRPSAVLHRSNTTEVSSEAKRTSSNSCKKVTSPSFDRVKASDATKNVSQLPRSGSTESAPFDANANDGVHECPRSVSKPTTAENNSAKASDLNILQSTLSPGYRKQATADSSLPSVKTSLNKLVTSTLATNLQLKSPSSVSTVTENREQKCAAQLEPNNSSKYAMLATSRDAEAVKETGTTVKPRPAVASLSFERISTPTRHSSVSMHNRVDTTLSVIENTVSPLRTTKNYTTNTTQTSSYVIVPEIQPFVPTTKSNKTESPYNRQECNLPPQSALNKNHETQKSSISGARKLDTWSTHKSEIRDKYGFAGEFRTTRMREPMDLDESTAIPLKKQTCTSVRGVSEKPTLTNVPDSSFEVTEDREQRSAAQLEPNHSSKYSMLTNMSTTLRDAGTVKETSTTVKPRLATISYQNAFLNSGSFSTPIQHSSVSMHNRVDTTPSVIENTVSPQRTTKNYTTNTTQTSGYATVPDIPPLFSTTKLNTTESPYYSQKCNLPQQRTLNKNHVTQRSSISEARRLDTWSTHKSEIGDKYGFAGEFRKTRMSEPKELDEPTAIPPQKQTYTSVHGVSEKPTVTAANFFVNDFNKEKFSQKPSEIPKPYSSNSVYKPIHCHPPSCSKESEDDVVLQPQLYLQNFTVKLQTSPKDKRFKPENDVIYHNQWTKCRTQIIDEFNSIVRSQYTVNVSSGSRFVDFRDSKIKKGRLHFTMRSSQTGNILVYVKIGNFAAITKNLQVSFNPCSSSLSELTIVKVDPAEDEFVFRVFMFDVFGEPIPSNSTVNLEVQASFHSTENEQVVKTEEIVEQEQLCYDITVRGKRAWSLDFYLFLNGEELDHPQDFEFTEEECDAINYLDDKDYKWIQEFFEESDCGLTIPFTTGEDDGVFVPYDENDCEIQSQNGKNIKLICKDVRKYDILGEDFAHIDNIKRVLELKDRLEIQENAEESIIDLRNVKPHLHPICKEVVEHLLRGLYYRWKASETARIRMEWKNRLLSIEEVMFLDTKSFNFVLCKYFKDFFGDLMNRYNREACDELFEFFNFSRDENEVDLHGLLVADEEKLELLRLNLMSGLLSTNQIIEILEIRKIRSRRNRERRTFRKEFRRGNIPKDLVQDFIEENIKDSDDDFDVDAVITRCRLESDEAIRKLKETLDNFDIDEAIENNTPWLEVIVGAGRHSRKNEQNIRPKVEKLLKARNCKFAAINKGSLVVTYQAYGGPQPCFGEYYCKNCDNPWKSSKSYIGKYQKCSRCENKCLPIRQREKEKVKNHYRESAQAKKSHSKPHQSSLCQRCQELGHHCDMDRYDSDY